MTDPLLVRARTNGRMLLAWLLLAGATAAALALGVTTQVTVKRIEREVTPCFRVEKTGRPSAECERLARLLARTCAVSPRLCRVAGDRLRGQLSRERERERSGDPEAPAPAGGADDESSSDGAGVAPAPEDGGGSGGEAPGGDGGPGGESPGGDGDPGPAPVPGPAPAEPEQDEDLVGVVNGAVDQVGDAVNDVTGEVLGVRPVPDVPDVVPLGHPP